MPDTKVGDRFQKETKYDRQRGFGQGPDPSSRPNPYKTYPDANQIALPKPGRPAEMSLDRAIRLRRSVRRYSTQELELDKLSYLLWAAGGLQREERGMRFRTVPSAGALYPIETYLVANRVADLPQGVYHYSLQEHALDELRLGEFGEDTAMAALGQRMCMDAPVVFIWSAIFQRTRWKYRQRAYRYIYLDAGHLAGNLTLAASALHLGTCQIGAIFDDEANRVVGIDGDEESVIYMSVAGHPK
jgi:SagB-type dehydrogenase family enzyme